MKIFSLQHCFSENSNFVLKREKGHTYYTFLHFFNSVEIMDKAGIITTKPHACIIYSPNTPQYFKTHGPLMHDWIHFYEVNDQFFNNLDLKVNQIFYPNKTQFITEIIKELEDEHYEPDDFSKELSSLKLRELFIKIARSIKQTDTNKKNTVIENLKVLRRKIFMKINQAWSVEKMAKSVGLSPSRFHFLYKKAFGISPTNDLINARIEKAKIELCTTDCTIENLAFKLGYNNTTHFIRQFKLITGYTPLEYRKYNE